MTNHDWVFMVNPAEGTVMPEIEYVTAIQHRLGYSFMEEPGICKVCQGFLDIQACHATCCATADATRGHYAVVQDLLRVMSTVDTATATEVRGLSTIEPSARPADILTYAAIPGRCAALDIVVASQEASGAGSDCLITTVKGKYRRYRRILQELNAAGISFRPMAWSKEGQPRSTTMLLLAYFV